jgi:hypothetical protein
MDRAQKIALIAEAFALVLIEWLSTEEWDEMRLRNANESNPNVCHSHDFCDANMAMDRAMTDFGYPLPLDLNEDHPSVVEHVEIWNEAWDLAKRLHLTGLPREDAPTMEVKVETEGQARYRAHIEELTSEAARTDVGRLFLAAGYTIEETGGGCLAWKKTGSRGHVVLVVDDDAGLGLDGRAKHWSAALYREDWIEDDAEMQQTGDFTSIEEVLAAAVQLLRPFDVYGPSPSAI